jgi:transglutaminase-like putative cysteine protease
MGGLGGAPHSFDSRHEVSYNRGMNLHRHDLLTPPEGWGVLLLTLALASVVGTAVAAAGWVDELHVMTGVTLAAFVIGLLIARSRLPVFPAHLFSLIIGLAWVFRLTADLMPHTYTWDERWAWLWYRLYVFAGQMIASGVSDDSLVFIVLMGMLVWTVTYLVVWSVLRAHRLWDAIILSGLLLLGTLVYAPRNLSGYLAIFLLVAMLLIIRFNLYLQEQIWRRARVHFNAGEITFDVWRAGLALTLVVLAVAWLAPAIPLTARSQVLATLRSPWYDLEERYGRLFTSLRQRSAPGADFSGQSLTLGGPRELSEAPVMEVAPSHRLYYWREVALDYYTGQHWVNTDADAVQFGAGYPPVPQVSFRAQVPVSHTVTVLIADTAVLATAGQPVWTSRASRARVSYVEESLAEGFSHIRSRVPFAAQEAYTVHGLQSAATVEQLRLAGDDYPEWVVARYLQLPDEVPERVHRLAHTIAATATNAYDRAAAVEAYLRQTITYNDNVAAPPPDRDAVDYVLFDLRQGYCDYYASAMVVLLRALGIPSRMAAGYAQGEYDYAKHAFVVRQRDAHAWPEVFFPHYGWVEFEPTSARPLVERPRATRRIQELAPPQSPPQAPAPEVTTPDTPPTPPPLTATPSVPNQPAASARLMALLGLLAVAAGGGLWLWWRRARSGRDPAETVYARMQRLAAWAGVVATACQTPYEYAARLATAVPAAQTAAWRVADVITRTRYAGRPLDPVAADEMVAAWRVLRPALMRAVLRHRLASTLGRSTGDRHPACPHSAR